MNYASFRIKKAELPDVLNKVCEELKTRFQKLSPSYEIEANFGKIIFKKDCLMPFYLEKGKITFASVDYHGLRRHSEPDSPWLKYRHSYLVLDGYTYLTALTKMLLCRQLSQKLDDEGIGKYREDPDEFKFKSLANWREEQSNIVGEHPETLKLLKKDIEDSLKQDKKFLPELF